MTNHQKQLSTPFSTGGGGHNFETRVQAFFVVLMLSGGFAPCLPPWSIKKIKLQGKYAGYDTDDAIVFIEDPNGKEERKLLCQIKHSISITNCNKNFAEVIQSAWNDFNKTEIFTKGKDLIALITGPLSNSDITDVRQFILEEARHSEGSEDFLRKVNLAKFSSRTKIKKLQVFRTHLKKANGGKDVSDDDLWQFLKNFHILGYDLDIKVGVTLSLLQSLLGQYSLEDTDALWTTIINETQFANQNAGTITIDSISDNIRSVFQKPGVKTTPKELGIKPSIMTATNLSVAKLAIANLLGGWDENVIKNDIRIVERLANEKYSEWISGVREILQQPGNPLSLKNGIWNVAKRQEMWQAFGASLFDEHLDRFKQIVVDVLREPDPQFELASKERYMANIQGNVLKHSHVLRKGLAESLALLGSQPEALKNCSRGKAESVAIISIREIFENSDWVLWASLNNLLPTLAEAAPEEFLNAVENTLRKSPCPFDEIFSQENTGIFGNNYMTGLLWALETLAWDEQYLVRVTVIFGHLASHDPGGNWGNRPANSLTTIFLPWLPQTIASVDKRKAAIQTLQKEFSVIAWKFLLTLLPGRSQTSMGSHKPAWRKIIPDDWRKSITNKEYWDQISFYADIAVETAKGNVAKLNELISNLDNLTKPSFEKLLEYLGAEEVINRSEEERTPLWIALMDFILKHRRYADTKWVLGPELVERIEQIAKNLTPQKPQNLYARLFSKQDFNLYEDIKNWEEQGRKLEENRRNAIREIIKYGGVKAVFQFAEKVDFPEKVGFSLGFVAEGNADTLILPNFLETENKKKTSFVTGFICGRHSNIGWEWVNQIDTAKWDKAQIGQFLSCLPFIQKTWEYSEKILGENEKEYWSRTGIYPYQAEDDLSLAIEKLIEYDRPIQALFCLNRIIHDKKPLDKTQAINALLKAVSSKETVNQMDGYNTIEIIKALQDDPETNQDALFRIEWLYLPLLTGPGKSGSPKLLEQRLASDPDFFCEVIRLLYRSKKETKSNKEPTEQQKLIAKNAWHLLNDWETLPGKQYDGGFSLDGFNTWLRNVKIKCEQSGHLDVALITIGQVLIHYVPDPDGLWIHRAIAEALNANDAEKMRNGFYTGILNSRGVYCVDPTGKPEKELAAKYRKQAEEVENAGYYRLANTIRNLVNSYEHEAKRNIEEHEDIENNSSQ